MGEVAASAALGMTVHVCTFDGSVDDWVVDGHVDHICPCSASLCLECATPFDLVDGGRVEADHVSLTYGSQVSVATVGGLRQ